MSVQFSFTGGSKAPTKARQSALHQGNASSPAANAEIEPKAVDQLATEISVEDMIIRLKNDGNILAEAGLFVRAISKWDEGLNLAPSSGVLHELKAQVLMEMEEYELALASAQLAVECEEKWSDSHLTLGRVYFNIGNLEAAKSSMEMALKLTIEQSDLTGRPRNENTSQFEVEAELDHVVKLIQLRSQMELAQVDVHPTPSTSEPTSSATSSMDVS
jgi:tetratricopeptide (TPR) repeat protein